MNTAFYTSRGKKKGFFTSEYFGSVGVQLRYTLDCPGIILYSGKKQLYMHSINLIAFSVMMTILKDFV